MAVDVDLRHVYWLGGSPCAGKSSVADLLAARHGLHVYRCDDAFSLHRHQIDPRRQPVFARLGRASCDELWMRPVARQIAEELAFYREEFPQILADLRAVPRTRPLIAEGAALLPDLVAGLGLARRRAIWVVPTEEFQRACYAEREWRHDVLASCTDKVRAWENWMARDAGFARAVAADAEERGYPVLSVDGTRPLSDIERVVEAHFGLRSRRSS
jgi:hypothetical protein